LKLGAKIIEFGGWDMPVYYSNVIDEHLTTRSKSGLFDICHMGEFFIEGKHVLDFLQKILAKDVNKLLDGKAFYTVMCNEKGGIIDDLLAYRFNQNKFMLVVNAANIEKDFRWLLGQKSFFDDATLIDKSKEIAKLDLQGPKSQEILQKLTGTDLKSLRRFCFTESTVNNVATIISRTGYTGEDGFELYFSSQDAIRQWNKLLGVGKEFGIKPIGLGARDTLRIEAGYSLYGHELNEEINPLEAGLGFTVSLDKDDFIGKNALLSIKDNDLKNKIIAFEMLERGIPRQDYIVYKKDVKIGNVTSGTMSPTFKKGIGLALIEARYAIVGEEIDVMIRDKTYKAKIVKRPFYKSKDKV
jgi:aminomethyltransferase